MYGLSLIWLSALILMGMSLSWMSSLILLRLVNTRAATRRADDRAAVIAGLSGVLREDPTATEQLRPYCTRARLMAEALLEFQGLIRGADQERMLEALRELGLVAVLDHRLQRGSLAGRLASVEALAALGGEEARTALRRAASDRRPEVRAAAIKGLADAGYPPSVGRLLDYAVSGDLTPSRLYDELMRQVVATDPAGAAAALQRSDLTPTLRALLLEALGAAGDYSVLPTLIAAAEEQDVEVRTAAIRGLGRLQHPAGREAIATAIADGHWVVRSAAAEAAGAAGFVELGDGLQELLGDPEWWVRLRAGQALLGLGREGLIRLHAAAASERPVAQRAAELALAERSAA